MARKLDLQRLEKDDQGTVPFSDNAANIPPSAPRGSRGSTRRKEAGDVMEKGESRMKEAGEWRQEE